MDDTRSPGPTFRARPDENIFEMVWTYFRVQMDLFWVQNQHFWTQMPSEVKNLWNDTRSPGHFFKTIDMEIFKIIWPSFRFQMDISWVPNWII